MTTTQLKIISMLFLIFSENILNIKEMDFGLQVNHMQAGTYQTWLCL